MLDSHFGLMVLYALLVSLFFAGLWRYEWRGRIKLFLQIFLGLLGGGLLLAFLMFPFPAQPPASFP
ncbi:MAG: hypothetical protein SX243_20050 [Acidobacteriota bacterium]|nr:hypothetical protein [Acidobacteriota bacterium]